MADFKITSKKYGDFIIQVDKKSIPSLSKHKWWVNNKGKYFYTKIRGKIILLHRFLMGAYSNGVVDHIDRNTHNNKLSNLRITTYSVNNSNKNGCGAIHYKYMSYNNKRKGHNDSYTIKFPKMTRRTFVDINSAKAYYIECLLNFGGLL